MVRIVSLSKQNRTLSLKYVQVLRRQALKLLLISLEEVSQIMYAFVPLFGLSSLTVVYVVRDTLISIR